MKKILMSIMALFMVAGCSLPTKKGVSMPKLKAKDISITPDQSLESLDYKDLIDETRLNDEQMAELKENGSIDLPEYSKDENGNILVGTYKIKISYFSDVVESIVTVEDPTLPYFNDVESVDVPVGQSWFDFTTVINAVSPIGSPLNYAFDTQYINWQAVDTYPMTVTVTDGEGRTVSKTVMVNII